MMARENLRRIAITGARGRIGSALCRRLPSISAVVEGYSIQPDSDNLLATRSLVDPRVVQNIDTLIHAGWSTMPLGAEQNPPSVWLDDLPLLAGILDAIRSLRPEERPLFVFLSSASVYGRNQEGCDEKEASPKPESWYAFGKLSAEGMIEEFARRFDLKCVILRLSNVYGISNGSFSQGVMPRLLEGAIKGEEVEIWGDGRTAKDYLHIDDALSAISKVIEYGASGVYNLSYGRSCSLDDLISHVEEIVGKPLRRKYCPAYSWDVSQPLIANRRFSAAFNWRPDVSVRDGLIKFKSDLGW
jgi:nucleoside-diphosphate-sugar epimerase